MGQSLFRPRTRQMEKLGRQYAMRYMPPRGNENKDGEPEVFYSNPKASSHGQGGAGSTSATQKQLTDTLGTYREKLVYGHAFC